MWKTEKLGGRIFYGALSLIIIGCFYSYLSYRQHQINPTDTTIPSFYKIYEGFKLATGPTFLKSWLFVDLKATLTRHFIGLSVSVLLSLIVGIAMGVWGKAAAFFTPPLSLLAKAPATAMLAVFFVLVGIGSELYWCMIIFGVFPTLAQSVYQSVKKDVSPEIVNKAYTLGASHAEVILEVVYKQIMPRFLDAIRLSVGPAMVYLIAAEWSLADVGIGYRLRLQSRLFNMNVVYVYLIILSATGYLMDGIITFTRRKLCPWFGE